jgi:hypothetical protein
MKIKYYYQFDLKTRLQLRKWVYKKSPYPPLDVFNQVYGFYIELLSNNSFKLLGLTYILP